MLANFKRRVSRDRLPRRCIYSLDTCDHAASCGCITTACLHRTKSQLKASSSRGKFFNPIRPHLSWIREQHANRTCESTRLSAREERLDSEGSRSRRCALVRDPSLLPPSVVDLADFKLAIVDAARAFIVCAHLSDLNHVPRAVRLSCIFDERIREKDFMLSSEAFFLCCRHDRKKTVSQFCRD